MSNIAKHRPKTHRQRHRSMSRYIVNDMKTTEHTSSTTSIDVEAHRQRHENDATTSSTTSIDVQTRQAVVIRHGITSYTTSIDVAPPPVPARGRAPPSPAIPRTQSRRTGTTSSTTSIDVQAGRDEVPWNNIVNDIDRCLYTSSTT